MLFLGIWFLQQILFGTMDLTNPTGGGGGVAYFAHIGGFVWGLAMIKLFANRDEGLHGWRSALPGVLTACSAPSLAED